MSEQEFEDNWYVRLAGTTRGRILGLLRRSESTVGELARALEISNNAVRGHLAILGRERLVEQRGVRRGTGGKPAHLYRIAPEAEELFPKAYASILDELLRALADRLDAAELDSLIMTVGERTARELTNGPGDGLRARTRTAARVLEELGGAVRVKEADGGFLIQGSSCPMDALVADHPELCRLAEALVSAIIGGEVRECCDRDRPPRCAFRIPGDSRA